MSSLVPLREPGPRPLTMASIVATNNTTTAVAYIVPAQIAMNAQPHLIKSGIGTLLEPREVRTAESLTSFPPNARAPNENWTYLSNLYRRRCSFSEQCQPGTEMVFRLVSLILPDLRHHPPRGRPLHQRLPMPATQHRHISRHLSR